MTRQQKKRRSEIIKALCDMSRNGWAGFTCADYLPLESELRKLESLR